MWNSVEAVRVSWLFGFIGCCLQEQGKQNERELMCLVQQSGTSWRTGTCSSNLIQAMCMVHTKGLKLLMQCANAKLLGILASLAVATILKLSTGCNMISNPAEALSATE